MSFLQTAGKVSIHSLFLVPYILTLLYADFLPCFAFVLNRSHSAQLRLHGLCALDTIDIGLATALLAVFWAH